MLKLKLKPMPSASVAERATALVLVLTCAVMIWAATSPTRDAAWAYNPDNLIRLHVVADSDRAEDQAIKLAVRDAVARYLAPAVADVHDRASAAAILSSKVAEVEAVANAVLAQYGSPYRARAEWGRALYPTRAYADLVVPAGEYDSLRVVLGRGAGRNWWCVLFPPLCFVDLAGGFVMPAAASALAEEQARLIAAHDPAELAPVVRWKLVELINRAPARFRALATWLAGMGGSKP